ncbi:MAG: hypothetical protein LBV34_07805, partial [Nocardiopsaceae bacterium]|nr:hypothetical protein [Nocardiopsaceae bacterium]
MRFELKDIGWTTEFWALDVDAEFDAAMAALAWERSGNGWLRRIACPAEATKPALANMKKFMLPLLRQMTDIDPVPWQDALDEVCRRFEGTGGIDWFLGGSAAL